MIKEFTSFLKHYGVIGLAIAVIIGGKLNDLVSAVVSGLLMPIVGRLTAVTGGDWRDWKPELLGIKFELGKVLGSGIDFVVVAFIVFWMAKTILREDTVTKK
ncbi:MAG: MscL family protein [Gemmatimonadetes bacterium]|jgi:large conductance mechanosensitive channel|nr:MscL family protein [Gemmatimonadota bacterium]